MGDTLGSLFTIAITYALVNNVVLSQFLGICPFLGVSKKTETAAGMGGAVIFVITVAAFVTGVIYKAILANKALLNMGIDLRYLKTIVFILVIASLVQMLEMFIKKTSPTLYKALGIYLPLITTNCAVLGVANASVDSTFIEMLVFALFSGLGFLFTMFIFSSLREKLAKAPIPEGFKGVPIALITASALALIFARLGGIV